MVPPLLDSSAVAAVCALKRRSGALSAPAFGVLLVEMKDLLPMNPLEVQGLGAGVSVWQQVAL